MGALRCLTANVDKKRTLGSQISALPPLKGRTANVLAAGSRAGANYLFRAAFPSHSRV